MKKNIIYLLLIATAGLLTACDDLLEAESENYVSDKGLINDQLSAQNALNGVYDGAAGAMSSSLQSWNNAVDNVVGFQGNVIVSFLQPSSDGGYSANYVAINRENFIISEVESLPDNKFTGNSKNLILAQAYALRALSYINLTVTFGAVPIVTKPSNATNQNGIKQSPREQVFAHALSDLNKAEELFGSDLSVADKGRISVWAVYALKARLFLYTEQWEKAEEYAAKVIENTAVFGLTDTPEEFFLTQKSYESIFEFPFSNADKLPFYTNYLPSTMGGRQDYIAASQLASLLNDPEIGGNRWQLVFRRTQADTDQTYFINVYAKTDGSSSIQTLRLAEQLLIRAEARLKKTAIDRIGAIADIDAIRNRAEVEPLTAASTLNTDELLLVIEDERRYELAFEGHRYFDIIRTGRAPQVFGIHEPRYLDPRFWVFPIPLSELNTDEDLVQNEAYL